MEKIYNKQQLEALHNELLRIKQRIQTSIQATRELLETDPKNIRGVEQVIDTVAEHTSTLDRVLDYIQADIDKLD